VRGVRKTFGGPGGALEVLRGVSFEVVAGEMVAVVGASGAGKTTLLHVLGGLERADAGSARLGDFDILGAGPRELARFLRRDVGFVFQFHHLLPDLSAEENVALPLVIGRAAWAGARRAARELLAAVGLEGRAAHAAGELSGGEQQRVAIARALVKRPRLVLADEPTGNLDERTGEEVGALLTTLCRARAARVLVATHNKGLAARCDRVLALRGGTIKN
jgi:lipoprotein-releasing system ATP-binding protein